MSRPRAARALLLLSAAALTLSGCLGDPIETGNDGALPDGHDEHHDGPTTPAPELGPPDVVLDAHAGMPERDLQLHPDPLRVGLGDIVEIRVENAGVTPHTFTIHAFDADTGMMEPGEARTIKFLADEAGSFEIMCDAPGHYQAGMSSTIEVAA